MEKIRWGIIGCGDVTEVKSGPAFQKIQNSELVAVMRRNANLAKDYAKRHNVSHWYSSAQQLIDDPEVDAVYIATPPSSHKKYTLNVAAAGKPVYVEKPMAMSNTECLEMIDACRKTGVPLFVAYYRRALPRFLKVGELLEKKMIGDVRAVTISLMQPPSENDVNHIKNWRTDPAIASCGYFCDLASHTFDLIQYLLGTITVAAGDASNQTHLYAAEDIVSAAWQHENGIHGNGLWCFTASENMDKVEIIGGNGTISFATFANQPVTLTMAGKKEEFFINHPTHIQQPLIQMITNELTGIGKSPSTGESAAKTSWVMDKILGRL